MDDENQLLQNKPLEQGDTRIRVHETHVSIIGRREITAFPGIRLYQTTHPFTLDYIPFTRYRHVPGLTWTQVREFKNPTKILHVLWAFWYAIAVCDESAEIQRVDSHRLSWLGARHKVPSVNPKVTQVQRRARLMSIADRIIDMCPEIVLGRDRHSISPQQIRDTHARLKSEYANPTGITFWFRMLRFVQHFDYTSIALIKATGGLKDLEDELMRSPGTLEDMRAELIAHSPYPHDVWGSIKREGSVTKTIVYAGKLSSPPTLSDTSCGMDFVLMSGGRTIFNPHPRSGPTTCAAST